MKLTWSKANAILPRDGALWDLYVPNTNVEDWDRVLREIENRGLSLKYTLAGEPKPKPPLSHIFATEWKSMPMFHAWMNGMLFNSQIRKPEEIVFDINPRDVADQSALILVGEFMMMLAHATGKRVQLTPERDHDYPLITYDPANREFYYHPD